MLETRAVTTVDGRRDGLPQLEDLVPPELPPDVAIARLVALAKSLLLENQQLREVLHRLALERSEAA